jgi:hypothetical protein
MRKVRRTAYLCRGFILDTINDDPPPAVVQAVTNLLDSVGAMRQFDEPARPREIIAAANDREQITEKARAALNRLQASKSRQTILAHRREALIKT